MLELQELAPFGLGTADEEADPFAGDLFADLDEEFYWGEEQEAQLAQMLVEGRERLAEVLYQLGRAYILLTVHPAFFRILSKEPVPIPEFRVRGKAIVDGVSASEEGLPDESRRLMQGFTEARELLDGELDSDDDNLEKGRKLLEECLLLDPSLPRARIWLGHYYWQKGEWEIAERLFRNLWRRLHEQARSGAEPLDPGTHVPLRIYALEHLGNLFLAQDQQYKALRVFRLIIASGAMGIHANFSTALLNFAYACLQVGADNDGIDALARLYAEFPSKRSEMGRIIGLRRDFLRLLDQPGFAGRLGRDCPEWFAPGARLLEHGQEISFQFLSKEPGSGTEA